MESKINSEIKKEYSNYSVLMSVYYKEKPEYLRESIESIVNQTVLTDDFVIICDGPLTKELDAVLDEYEKKFDYINIYRLEKNQGLGLALNYGLSKCKNEIVGRMDSDDISVSNRFEKQLDEFGKSDFDVIGGNIEEFYEKINDKKIIRKVPNDLSGIRKMCKVRNPMNHVSVLFKKSSIEDVGGYMNLPYLEDYYLWIRMLNKGYNLFNIDLTLVHVRTGKNMYVRRGNKQQIKGWLTLQKEMKSGNLISQIEMVRNMIYIFGFVYCPPKLKEFVYATLLRRKVNNDCQ